MENQHGTRGVQNFRFTLFSYQLHSAAMKDPNFYGTPSFIIFPQDTNNILHTKPVTSKPQFLFLFDSISVIPHVRLLGILTDWSLALRLCA